MNAEIIALYVTTGLMLIWNIVQQMQIMREGLHERCAQATISVHRTDSENALVLINEGPVAMIIRGFEDDDGNRIDCFRPGWTPLLMEHDGAVVRLREDAPEWVHVKWRPYRFRFNLLGHRYYYSMIRIGSNRA